MDATIDDCACYHLIQARKIYQVISHPNLTRSDPISIIRVAMIDNDCCDYFVLLLQNYLELCRVVPNWIITPMKPDRIFKTRSNEIIARIKSIWFVQVLFIDLGADEYRLLLSTHDAPKPQLVTAQQKGEKTGPKFLFHHAPVTTLSIK